MPCITDPQWKHSIEERARYTEEISNSNSQFVPNEEDQIVLPWRKIWNMCIATLYNKAGILFSSYERLRHPGYGKA